MRRTLKEKADIVSGRYTVPELEEIARRVRVDILKMLNHAKSGHSGGSLSAVEILVSLYFSVMNHKPGDPYWKERDRFILSKGHAAPLLYAVLAHCGYIPKEELFTLRQIGSRLQGHPHGGSIPGVDVSTGSLGQGLAMGNGMALGLRLDCSPARVYVLLGDGEIQEGMIWEAAMAAAHHKIDNLCAILDNNGLQIDGAVASVMCIEPVADKFRSFGWEVLVVDGHDIAEITRALKDTKAVRGKPSIIIAKTVKGKGVSFMEGKFQYHGLPPTDEELVRALKELGEK